MSHIVRGPCVFERELLICSPADLASPRKLVVSWHSKPSIWVSGARVQSARLRGVYRMLSHLKALCLVHTLALMYKGSLLLHRFPF